MKKIYKAALCLAILSSLAGCSSMKASNFVKEQNCVEAPTKDLRLYCYQQQAQLGDGAAAAELVKYYSHSYINKPTLAEKYKAIVMASDDTDAKLAVLSTDEKDKKYEILEREVRKGDTEALEYLISKLGTKPYESLVLESDNPDLMLTLVDELRFENLSLGKVILEKAASQGSQEALERLSHYDVFSLTNSELNQHHQKMAERGSVASMSLLVRDEIDADKWVDRAVQRNSVEGLKGLKSVLEENPRRHEANIVKVTNALVEQGDLDTIIAVADELADDPRRNQLYDILGSDGHIDSVLEELSRKSRWEMKRYYGDFLAYAMNQRNYKALEFSLDQHVLSSYELYEHLDQDDDRSSLLVADYLAGRETDLAIELYGRLSAKGNMLADVGLLRLYLDQGRYFKQKNTRKIHALLDRLIESGNVEAMVVKADIKIDRNLHEVRQEDFEEALSLLQRAYDNDYRPDNDDLLALYALILVGKFEVDAELQQKAHAFVSDSAAEGNELAQKALRRADDIKNQRSVSRH